MRFIVVVLLAAALAAGCGKSIPQTPEQVAAAKAKEVTAQQRKQALQDCRRLLARTTGSPAWQDSLSMDWREITLRNACSEMRVAKDMARGFESMARYRFSWKEVGLDSLSTVAFNRGIALQASKDLLASLKTERRIRQLVPCGDALYFADPLAVGADLKSMLKQAVSSPSEIGSSAAEIRQLVLSDLRQWLREFEASGDMATVDHVTREAIASWGFTWEEMASTRRSSIRR